MFNLENCSLRKYCHHRQVTSLRKLITYWTRFISVVIVDGVFFLQKISQTSTADNEQKLDMYNYLHSRHYNETRSKWPGDSPSNSSYLKYLENIHFTDANV